MNVVNLLNIFTIHLLTWVITNKTLQQLFLNQYNNGNWLCEVYSTFEEFDIASELESHMTAHNNILTHKDKIILL